MERYTARSTALSTQCEELTTRRDTTHHTPSCPLSDIFRGQSIWEPFLIKSEQLTFKAILLKKKKFVADVYRDLYL